MFKKIKNFIYPPCPDYYIHVYLGLPRNGKTLWIIENEILPLLRKGEEVWSSTWINWNGNNIHYFDDAEQVLKVRNATVFFDEIAHYIDPRAYEQESLEIRKWLQLHGHYRNNLIFDTQDISLVAKSVRILVSRWFVMEKLFIHNYFGCIAVCRTETTLRNVNMREKGLFVGATYDDDGEIIREDGDKEISRWLITTPQKLRHMELKKYKLKKECYFCPECGSNYLESHACPRHGNILVPVPAPMYDTYIDPPIPEKPDIVWIPFKHQKKLTRYNGNCKNPNK